jgi:hypothetical protein
MSHIPLGSNPYITCDAVALSGQNLEPNKTDPDFAFCCTVASILNNLMFVIHFYDILQATLYLYVNLLALIFT